MQSRQHDGVVMNPLKAVALSALAFLTTMVLADIPPTIGTWGYSAHMCTNNTGFSFLAGECGTLTVGTWTVTNSGPYCANETYPFPWPNESYIETRVSAHANASASFHGWLSPGGSTTCLGFFDTKSYTVTAGVESSNFGLLTVGGAPGAYGARRDRLVECPKGSVWDNLTQTCNRQTVADPYKTFNECPANGTNPVNAYSAEKIHVETDIVGVGEAPLKFIRYYSSRTEWRLALWDESGFGSYWRHTYSRRVQYSLQGATGFVTVYRENGNRYYFKKPSSATVWSAVDADVTDKLESIVESGQTYWIYANAQGVKEKYAGATGRLVELKSPQGFVTTLTYNTAGQLDIVSNEFGQGLKFIYFTSGVGKGLISTISVLSNGSPITGTDYRYEYVNSGQGTVVIGKVYYPDTTPSNSTDNPYKEYKYNEHTLLYNDYLADTDAGLATKQGNVPRFLTGIVDENGARYATYKYQVELFSGGTQLWVPRWGGHGTPDAVSGKYADEFKLTDYSSVMFTVSESTPGFVQIRDANGIFRSFNFARSLGVNRTTSITTPANAPCEGCGNNAQQTTYSSGFVASKLDFGQNKTLYNHDLSGLEVCRLEGISIADPTKNAPRRTVTTWDTTYRVPTEVRVYEPLASAVLTVCDDTVDTSWTLRKKTTTTYEAGSARVSTRTSRSYANGVEDETARTTTYSYYQPGESGGMKYQLKSVDGSRTDVSDVTTYQYATARSANHRVGELISITNALGHVTSIVQHDSVGHATQIVSPTGSTTVLNYHPRGWLLSRTVDGNLTTFTYDKVGQLDRIAGPRGDYIDYDYDAAHRVIDIRDNLGNRIHYTLDALGNQVKEDITDVSGTLRRSLQRVYKNENNRLEKLINIVDSAGLATAITTGFKYDNNGNPEVVIDPRDLNISATTPLPALPTNLTVTTFDALNRATKTAQPNIGSTAHQTTTTYDVNDRVTGIVDPAGRETIYTNNGFGEVRTQQSPDTGATSYQYDTAGNLVSRNDARPSAAAVLQYDAMNRLKKLDYPSTTQVDVTLTYDENSQGQNGKDRLTSVLDESGEMRYRYDKRGNLQWVTAIFDGVPANTYSVGFKYDGADRLTRIVYPSGRIVNFNLDAAGRIVSADTVHLGVTATLFSDGTYAPFGPATGFHYGASSSSAPVYSRTLDLSYRVTALSHSNGLLDRQYSYLEGARQSNNITAITDLLGTGSQSFTYDVLERLTAASSPNTYGTQNFIDQPYDALGNRKGSNITGRGVQAYAYAPGTGRLESVTPGGPSYAYDAKGNATQRQGLIYGYGDDARIEQITSSGTPLANYAHSYTGQRTKKTVGGTSNYFVYGLAGELLAEVGTGGAVNVEYVYLDGMPVALVTPEGARAADGDGDLIPDAWEIAHGLAADDSADGSQDSDGDGATNLAEYQNGTEPWNPDTDSDQLPDGWEIRYGLLPTNPVDAATDEEPDGLTNAQEFLRGSDPRNPDTDKDTLLDGSDPAPLSPSWLAPVTHTLLQ